MANPAKGNRLSSLFSLGHTRDGSNSSLSHSPASSPAHDTTPEHPPARIIQAPQSPSQQKLRKTDQSRGNAPSLLDTSTTSPLIPPPVLTGDGPPRPPSSTGTLSAPQSRAGSREGSRSRPSTPVNMSTVDSTGSPLLLPSTPGSDKASKRRSWMPGKLGKAAADPAGGAPQAWIAGASQHIAYDLTPLITGDTVAELWNEDADTYVYLFPPGTRKRPSFKVDSGLFSYSKTLKSMLRPSGMTLREQEVRSSDSRTLEETIRNASLASQNGVPHSQYPGATNGFTSRAATSGAHFEKELALPLAFESDLSLPYDQLKSDDLELLVLYRNFFSFLLGGALVATPRQVALYPIFLGIATVLQRFEFSNGDSSTFGEPSLGSFSRYCKELRLADVRSSREKTIEAVVLGERMKSWSLYNEGFVHAAGKLSQMKKIDSPKYNQISPATRNRLERAAIDLEGRLRTVEYKLADFEFPSMFSGIANSQTATEAKMVHFKVWKTAFADFRKHITSHYKHRYGAWPPVASSKKNNFEQSGLNRLVLLEIYQDFTDLYDMLVDRSSLTDRKIDMDASDIDAESNDPNESTQHAIRRVESEYDRSTPPVQPPVPFDVPLLPSLAASFNRTHVETPQKDLKERSRRLKDNEVNEILLGSYNRESMKATPWLEDFLHYERRSGHGKNVDELADLRCGQWLLLYAILQALPMCVVDARDLEFTNGVEYFLCLSPRGGRPWIKEDTSQSRNWYNVANGGGMVSLPADAIDHSVEGIYRRSHCWTAAAKWAQEKGIFSPSTQASLGAPLPPPPVIGGRPGRPASPHLSPNLRPESPLLTEPGLRRNANRSSMALGLEEAAAPPVQARPVSVLNPNLTFDTILGNSNPNAPSLGLKKDKGKK